MELVNIFNKGDGLKFSDIRLNKLVYFLAYPLELILFTTRGQFLPIGSTIFGINGWSVVHTVHMIASLVFMLLWSDRFKKLIDVAIVLMLVGFIPFIFMPMGITRAMFGMVFYIGLAGAVTACRCAYAFVINNAERLVGMLMMFISVALIRFIRSLGAEGIIVSYILPLLLMFALCFCLFKFKEDDFNVKQEVNNQDKKGLYWAFALFALYFAFDGYNASLVHGYKNPDFIFFFIGMLLAGLIMFVAIGKLRINTWHIWNIFFIASFCMGLFAYFAIAINSEKPQYFFGGLSMIGWPLCIYTMACAQRRYASYKLLKRCTLVYVILSPLISLSSDLVESFIPESLPLISMLFILFFGIIFLILSPFSYNYLFSADWISDIYKPDMELFIDKVEQKDKFSKYNLTPRQKQVAVLLLAAKTGRQIAGELGLSEPTIKLHTSELYKRLGINSRVELFKLFGVSDTDN